jgi:hypothetical protein
VTLWPKVAEELLATTDVELAAWSTVRPAVPVDGAKVQSPE